MSQELKDGILRRLSEQSNVEMDNQRINRTLLLTAKKAPPFEVPSRPLWEIMTKRMW